MTEPRARTILIVDDEAQNRKLLEALLHPEGYLTITANSGDEALTAVRAHQPDLILLDLMMPGMDGHQVTKILKSDAGTSSIPIIMVTAQTDRSALLDALEAGVEEFLTKPVNRAELWLRVRNLLRLKEMRDLLDGQNASLERVVSARTAELQRFRTAMDETGDAIFLVDGEGRHFTEVNATATRMFGYSRQEFLGLGTISMAATTQIELERLRDAIVGGPVGEKLAEAKIRRKDGLHLPVEIHRRVQETDSELITVGVVRDITEREEAHLRLYQMAHQDALTGLPNRTMFFETLAKTISQAKMNNWGVAVLYVDLDHFKSVNDTHGHAMGDTLLVQVSDRLLQCVRLRDTVGRLGGDEFAVILIMNERHEGADVVVRNIREKLRAAVHPRELRGNGDGEHRRDAVPRRRDGPRGPHHLCRHGDVPGQAGGARHALCVHAADERRAPDAAELGGGLAQGDGKGGIRRLLPAESRSAHRADQRPRGTPPLGTARSRIGGAELLHPHARGDRDDRRGRELGDCESLPADCRRGQRSPLGAIEVSVNVSGRQFINHDLDGDVSQP